ncbi:hypothetical protein [Ekhidna sp.]|uniref:hypothetical protein n=1 Tax=Ekhidna sp. TaxID=2608089 RepID=UPI0032EE1CA6
MFKTAIIYFERRIAFLIVLTLIGLEVVGNNSVIGFDPKLFVCLATIGGFYFLLKNNYLLSSLFLAFGFWTWQPAGVNFIFLGFMFFKESEFKRIIPVLLGFLVASLPSLVYLFVTDQIGDFYQQSLVGRIQLGTSNMPILPFKFLYNPFKFHQSDLLIYLAMFLGFFIPILRKRIDSQTKNLLIFTLIWVLLFFKEYGYRDLIPILGILVLWSGYLYEWAFVQRKMDFKVLTFLLVLVFYFDAFSNHRTFQNQKREFQKLDNNYDFQKGNYLTLGANSEAFSFINDTHTYKLLVRLNNFNIQEPTCDELIQDMGFKVKYLIVDKPAIQKERNFDCGNRIISIINKSQPIYESETIMVFEL